MKWLPRQGLFFINSSMRGLEPPPCYLSFRHSDNDWEEIRKNVFNGLKIYNFSATYAINESMQLTAGRKINPKLSSAGAIDGIQFEKRFGALTTGFITGTRPDYEDYSVNLGLFQYGAYVSHETDVLHGKMQNTVAVLQQMNGALTDRRFAYFQHTSNLYKDSQNNVHLVHTILSLPSNHTSLSLLQSSLWQNWPCMISLPTSI